MAGWIDWDTSVHREGSRKRNDTLLVILAETRNLYRLSANTVPALETTTSYHSGVATPSCHYLRLRLLPVDPIALADLYTLIRDANLGAHTRTLAAILSIITTYVRVNRVYCPTNRQAFMDN